MTAVVIIAIFIFLLLSIFQIALAAGAPLGRFAWGGQHVVLPRRLRIGSAMSVIIYAAMAALLLSKSGIWVVISDETVVQTGLWVCSIYFVLGGLLNAISRSKSERYVMTPVAAVLAACFFVVTLHTADYKTINSFQACKDAGGVIMESYPEQCRIEGKLFVNDAQSVQPNEQSDEYVGLTEQEALDKAERAGKARRVVERDNEPLPVTMDFAPGRLNFHVKDGRVYKVEVEG